MQKFEGVFTALVTPFKKNGAVDEEKLRELVDFQIENGVAGLVPCGTTGESPTLSHEEHNIVVDIVINQAKGRVPVIAGTGSNSTEEALNLTKHAKEAGADAVLLVNPYYNKPTQKGLYEHFKALNDAVDIPMILYNIKGRTGINVETPTMAKLAQLKNIVAVKEASGDINQMMDVINKAPDDFIVLSGDDNMTLPLIGLGGKGVVSVLSNLLPGKMVKMVSSALKGEWDEARKLHYELMPLFKAEFIETNPIPIKAMMAMKGMINEIYRLPMCSLSEENRKKAEQVMKDAGIL